MVKKEQSKETVHVDSPGKGMISRPAPFTITASEKDNEHRSFLGNVCKPALKHAADSRRRYDYEWMVRDLFRRGYHFSRYQPSTQTVVLASRQTARVPINVLTAQMRSIRNQVTSFRPKFECLPRFTTEESQVQARYSGQLLDYFFEHLKFKKKIKETVTQGLMYSIGGPWKIYYDTERKEVRVWLVDPFDFYFDPLAEDDDDCEYQIIATRRPYSDIVTNPDFDKDARKEITGGEARLAVSEYKQFMIQSLRYVNRYNNEENPTVILFDGSFKIRDEDTGESYIRHVVWTDQNTIPLLWEDTDEDEYDTAIYHADLNPKEILGESWMKHTMPINRVIDNLESSVFEYNYRVAKGRIVVDRDSGVRAIHNVHGEIISKNKGAEVRALDMPALPIAVADQIARMSRYMEDIGGAHDASLGRVPAGVKSGIGIAELKQADSTSQDDLVDNLEDFLSEVGRKLLKKVAKHYTNYQVVQTLGHREQDTKYFAVVGSEAGKKGNQDKAHQNQVKIGPDWLDLAIIGKDNNVRVTIGSWLGYTKEQMQEKTLKLFQLGAIDQKTFLRLWEFGNIDTIVQETRRELLLKKQLQQPMQPGQEVDQFSLAQTENEMLTLEGKPVPAQPQDDHLVHVAVHQEMLGRGADFIVGQHIAQHQVYMESGQPSSAQPPVQQQQPPMGGGMGQGNPNPTPAPSIPGISPNMGQPQMNMQQRPPVINIENKIPQAGSLGFGG